MIKKRLVTHIETRRQDLPVRHIDPAQLTLDNWEKLHPEFTIVSTETSGRGADTRYYRYDNTVKILTVEWRTL